MERVIIPLGGRRGTRGGRFQFHNNQRLPRQRSFASLPGTATAVNHETQTEVPLAADRVIQSRRTASRAVQTVADQEPEPVVNPLEPYETIQGIKVVSRPLYDDLAVKNMFHRRSADAFRSWTRQATAWCEDKKVPEEYRYNAIRRVVQALVRLSVSEEEFTYSLGSKKVRDGIDRANELASGIVSGPRPRRQWYEIAIEWAYMILLVAATLFSAQVVMRSHFHSARRFERDGLCPFWWKVTIGFWCWVAIAAWELYMRFSRWRLVVVPAICAYPKSLEQIDTGCRRAVPPANWSHESNRVLTRLVPPIDECFHCFVHSPCICNEVVSATNRVLGAVPKPTPVGLRSLRKAARRLTRSLHPVQPWSFDEVLERSFKGPRKTRYANARLSLETSPLTTRDAIISAFVKSEKFDPSAKVNPDPRMIQARNARYNICLARFLKPMEEQLYNIKGGFTKTRLIAKGLNQVQRADMLLRKWKAYRRPVCYSLDASRWDKHCDVALLKIEHSVYNALCPDVELSQLLRQQLENRCRTANGVKYRTLGKRMSGDMNTALGNCLLMVICLFSACHDLGLRKYDVLDDGDDCLVIVEEEDESKLAGIVDYFLNYGHELKLENRATTIHSVKFCQSSIVNRCGLPPTFVRNWVKILSTACCGSQYWHESRMVRPLMGAIADCELSLNQGVPIIQEFCNRLREISGTSQRPKLLSELGIVHRATGELGVRGASATEVLEHAKRVKPTPIDYEARWSFYLAFGVDVQRQLDIEAALRAWSPDIDSPAIPAPLELDHRWVHRLAPELLGRETY